MHQIGEHAYHIYYAILTPQIHSYTCISMCYRSHVRRGYQRTSASRLRLPPPQAGHATDGNGRLTADLSFTSTLRWCYTQAIYV